MNNLISKIVGVCLGLSLATGVAVGVGAGNQEVKAAYAADSGLTASDGTFIIDFYDSTKLNSTSGTGLSSSNYSSFVKVASGLTATSVVTGVSVTGTVQYGKNGGLTAGTGSNTSENTNYFSFTISSTYAVNKCTVYATEYESGRWKLNGDAADSGSLGAKGAAFASVTSPLIWDNLGGLTTLTFKKDNGSNGNQKRLTIYTIVCEYAVGSSKTDVALTGTDFSVKVGDADVTPTVKAGNDTLTSSQYSLTSGDTNIATIVSGKVHAVAAGRTAITITPTLPDTDTIHYVSGSLTVTVTESNYIIFELLGLENSVQYLTPFASDDFTITFAGGENDGKYYDTGSGVRTYSGGSFTIASTKTGYNIISAVFTWDGTYAPGQKGNYTLSSGSYSDDEWSGNASSVTITRASASDHWRMKSVKVTLGQGAILSSIAVSGTMTKTSYGTDEQWNPTGLVVTATYTNGQSSEVTNNGVTWTYSPAAPNSTSIVSVTATASYTEGGVTKTADSDPQSVTVGAPKGTETNPYSVAEAIAAIDEYGTLSGKYTHGIICQVDSYSDQYHSITYWISDDGYTTTKLQVYSGKDLESADFSSVDDLQVDDVVTVCGDLKKYNSTYEYDKNNYLTSWQRPVITLSAITGIEGSLQAGLDDTDWELSGLVVKGTLSNGHTNEDVTSMVTLSTNDHPNGVAGSTTVSVTATPKEGTATAQTFNVSATISDTFNRTNGEYHIAEQSDIVVGAHIVIAAGEDDLVMADYADGNNFPSASGTKNATKGIVDKTNATDLEIVAGSTSGTYAMKTSDGKYLYAAGGTGGSAKNYLKTQSTVDNKASFSFTKVSDTNWTIVASGGAAKDTIRFNSGNNPPIFSCYSTGQDNVTVYVFKTYRIEATEYATSFNSANVCGTDDNTPAIKSVWTAQQTRWGTLTTGAQNLLTNGTANQNGDAIGQCLARYDRVISKRGTTDFPNFMSRNGSGSNIIRPMASISDNNAAIFALVAISMVTMTVVGAYFFLRKKKEVK